MRNAVNRALRGRARHDRVRERQRASARGRRRPRRSATPAATRTSAARAGSSSSRSTARCARSSSIRVENAAVQKALDELTTSATELIDARGRARDPRVGRVHLHQPDAAAARPRQLRQLQPPPVAVPRGGHRHRCTLQTSADGEGLAASSSSLLQAPAPRIRRDALRRSSSSRLEAAGVTAFTARRRRREQPDDDDREKVEGAREATYAQSVAATKDLMTSVRMGAQPEHQEDQARGAGHRRPDPQRGDVADRPDDDPRLRRVHVHAQRQRLHLLRRARQATRPQQAAAVRSRHGGAVPRHRQVARAAVDVLNKTERSDRRRVAPDRRAPVARRARAVPAARRSRSCRTAR